MMNNEQADNPIDVAALLKRQPERQRSADVPTIYANNVSIKTSLWDMTIDFGLIVEATLEALVYRDEVTIIMSPQHAKVFAEAMTKTVEQYEQQYGPIPRPLLPNQDEV